MADDTADLEFASADDFAHLHEETTDVPVETEGGEKKIRIRKLTQKDRDKYFEEGIEALEDDRELAAAFIDDVVVRPDFADAFEVEKLHEEHLDKLGMFSFEALFWAILKGSGVELSTKTQADAMEIGEGNFQNSN